MDRLADAWQVVEARYGVESPSSDIASRAVMGVALMLALEAHHNRRFKRDRALDAVSEGTVRGFFPTLAPARKR
jgi:hypothetical protein